ncbi:MFS general substrate transporter [Pterulicium gracile]|uniref:MFS general substrate transporter n=1 Tax=Pterulicium gracile TaxID=1884261 RepID=A0A5C3QLA0_9AGAR|nr:MFS general substrate transporter [Pterula gracilis]
MSQVELSQEKKGREEGDTASSEQLQDNAQVPLYNAHVDISRIDEKKLIRKIDWALIPWLSLLYLLSFLDRTKDLGMGNTQYLSTLTIFFFSYAVFEVPSNLFLKRLRPSIWLSGLMLLWTLQRVVTNYGGLLTMRWWLGVFEAGLVPGVNHYLSCGRSGIRVALFFSAASVSGAFGRLLAAAIANMDGVGGRPGWAWIFILEGLATVIAGVISFWVIQDFPDTAKFLSEAERTVVVRRLQEDDQFSAGGESLRWKYIRSSFADWKAWVGMLMYSGSDMPLYAFALFLPTIINQVTTAANLLTVPVYIFACLVTCLVGFSADRFGQRGLFNLGLLSLSFIAYIILAVSSTPALSYFAVYLATCGIYPVIRDAWMSNNVEGSYKRSVSLGMVISFGNINGAVSSNVVRHSLVLVYISFGLITTIGYRWAVKCENAKGDRDEGDEVIEGVDNPNARRENGTYANVAEAKREKGDRWSGYRYIL